MEKGRVGSMATNAGTAEHILVWGGGGGGLKLMGVNLKQKSLALAFLRGSGACPSSPSTRKMLTDTSSKMAQNASKYVRRNG